MAASENNSTVPNETKLSLASKLAAIGNEIGVTAKTGTNAQQKFDYIEYATVSGKVRSLFDKYKVIILPQVDDYEVKEVKNKYGNIGYHYTLRMSFLIKDGESDESFERKWLSESIDFGDKSINKAETAGTKYFYMRLFNVSEKGEQETDKITPEIVASESANPTQVAGDYKKLDFDDIRETLSAIDDLNSVNEYAKEVAAKFPKMTENQRNTVAKIFEEKRKEFEK